MKPGLVNPPERDEAIGFTEDEEISWREYFTDFRQTVWPMFEAEGFTFFEAIMFWRHEIMLGHIMLIKERLREES